MATKKATTKRTAARKTRAKANQTAKKAPPVKSSKPTANNNAKKLSALDAAAKVLADVKQPMSCKELIEAMAAKKLWSSPGGRTPHATLYSAILREVRAKGKDARFQKVERGRFAVNG